MTRSLQHKEFQLFASRIINFVKMIKFEQKERQTQLKNMFLEEFDEDDKKADMKDTRNGVNNVGMDKRLHACMNDNSLHLSSKTSTTMTMPV